MDRKLPFYKKTFKGLGLILLGCILTGLVHADPCPSQEGSDDVAGEIQKNRSKADTVEKEIEKKRDQIRVFAKKERKLVSELDGLDRAIDHANQCLRSLLAEELHIIGKMQKIEQEQISVTEELEQLEEDVKGRLVASYKLGRLRIAPVLFSGESFTAVWQRYHDIETILSNDVLVRENFRGQKVKLDLIARSLENRRRDIEGIRTRVLEKQRTIAEKRAERAGLFVHIHNGKESALTVIEELSEASRKLDDTIKRLEEAEKREAEKTGKEFPLFTAQKGLLPMPVKGSIANPFGRYKHPTLNIYHFRNGLEIEAQKGALIRAVHAGKVLYAGWFKGYGNIMVIDHGEGYYSLSAHALSLAKEVGETVKCAEVIGAVGDTGSLKGPCLYFEIRHHGKPVNPEVWLGNGAKITKMGCLGTVKKSQFMALQGI